MAIPVQRDAEQTRIALASWLAPRLSADGDVTLGELRGPGATGFSNETLIVDASWTAAGELHEASYVVRVAPTGYSLFPDAAFDTQYRVLRALAETSIPVPTVRWYETDPAVLGAPFFVMDEVRGRVPPDNPPYHISGWLFDVSPEHRARLWWGAIDAMADLHRLDPAQCGLDFLTGGLGEGLAYYESFLERVEKDEPVPTARRALDWLRSNLPAEQPRVLTWGDARIGNVIYDDDANVLAVLDWEMVGLGAPAQDVAWALFLDRHHSEGCDVPRLEGFPSTAETVEHYESRSGIPLQDLDFYEVYSAFRFCVIMGRLAVIFKDWDLLPPDDTMAQDNTVTRLTERVLAERSSS
jgi:aminoglycoside phosphotransferase (APT) family kinase protein